MTPNGLLAFLNGPVVLPCSYSEAVPVANHIERQNFCLIVLVSFFFLKVTLDESVRTIEIGIIARIESMPPPCSGGVPFGRTAERQQDDGSCKCRVPCAMLHPVPLFSSLLLPSDNESCTRPRRLLYKWSSRVQW